MPYFSDVSQKHRHVTFWLFFLRLSTGLHVGVRILNFT